MCGIVGLVADERAVLAGGIEQMVGGLRHRGPDAEGHRSFGTCALGHTRLRIVDLSPLGDQPLTNEDGSVWTVFNGEIYNFAELRSELQAAGHRFRSATDTEVLVHLYEEHGTDLARHLRGMFAFAIWDDRRKRLLLCRDRLGIKPLYYRIGGGQLSFASEVQTLARAGDGVDPAAVHGYLRLGWVPGPGTIRPGVSELLPGHHLVWEQGGGEPARYWSPPLPAPGAPAPTTEELNEVLLDAMRRHLVADVPVGLFLSSGVDSVVIGRLAGAVAPGLRTYTVAFDTSGDESTDAASLAARLGLEHSVVRVGASEAVASVGRFVHDMDQPTVDGLNSWIISQAVRDAGLVVALSGLGGDELFAGYSTFRHVPNIVRAGKVARFLPGGPGLAAAALGRSPRTAHSRNRRALEAAGTGAWGPSYAAVRGLFGAGELDRIQPSGNGLTTELVVVPTNIDQPAAAVVGHMEMANYLPFQLLRDTDCMSMAHALEVRVPLLDDRVVELALRGQASDGHWDKRRLLAAVDPDLAYLAGQPKRTFTLPISQWMRGGLRHATEDALVSLGESGLGIERRELTNLWHGHLRGQVGWRPVWALAVLGMWLERHRSAPTTAPPHAHAS